VRRRWRLAGTAVCSRHCFRFIGGKAEWAATSNEVAYFVKLEGRFGLGPPKLQACSAHRDPATTRRSFRFMTNLAPPITARAPQSTYVQEEKPLHRRNGDHLIEHEHPSLQCRWTCIYFQTFLKVFRYVASLRYVRTNSKGDLEASLHLLLV